MKCDIHDAPHPCQYCQWAESGNPDWAIGASNRADRVAGRTAAVQATPPALPRKPTPGLARQIAVLKLAKECPHRSKASCGCSEPYRCALAGNATVTWEDCGRCLDNQGHDLPPP